MNFASAAELTKQLQEYGEALAKAEQESARLKEAEKLLDEAHGLIEELKEEIVFLKRRSDGYRDAIATLKAREIELMAQVQRRSPSTKMNISARVETALLDARERVAKEHGSNERELTRSGSKLFVRCYSFNR
jgi:chromosome segregation ATPase